jgi:hypothetical protein
MKRIICVTAMMFVGSLAFAGPNPQPVTKEDFAKVCPLDLAGASAASSPTADGVAVTFSTTVASWLPELKTRVEKLSDLLNRAMTQSLTGANRPAVPFVSTFEATKDGARLVLKPKPGGDLEKLQVNIAGKIGSMNAQKTCSLLANIN